MTDAHALQSLPVEDLVAPLLLQLAVIVGCARIAGAVARRLWQPSSVGEIVAGLLLGPSLFGWLAPEWSAALFHPSLPGVSPELAAAAFPKILQSLAQLGLVFLLFLIGLEFEFSHLKSVGRTAVHISVAGIALPFALGAALAPLAHPYLEVHPLTGATRAFTRPDAVHGRGDVDHRDPDPRPDAHRVGRQPH